MEEALHFVTKTGTSILDFADDFAQLRIKVFYDFPYLYEGTVAYELEYIQTYAACDKAMVFAVYNGEKMVGATTCVPLADETPNVQQPFLIHGYTISEVFYFGESMLMHPYRGKGLGHRFFDERENYARANGAKIAAFCAVERPEDHPLLADGHRPNDAFWRKRGYTKMPELTCQMSWLDRDQSDPDSKTLTFWIKTL